MRGNAILKSDGLSFASDTDAYSRAKADPGVTIMIFGVSWSAACNIQNSIAQRVAMLFKDAVSVCGIDIDNVPQAKTDYDIASVPTVVILRDGLELKRFSGVQPERVLAHEINVLTGSYESEQERDIQWEALLDREREKTLLHRKILIVDDDPDVTFCVMTILQEARFDNVSVADSYASAIAQVKESVPDLIFLNISMENREGNRFLLSMQRHKAWNTIPILVSVGPLASSRVYEDSFKETAILRHGKYVEHPSTRDAFVSLVRHMLLYNKEEFDRESRVMSIAGVCPPDRRGM